MAYQNSNIKIFFFILLFCFLFIRCEDERQTFPYVYINETFYIDTELNDLTVGEYLFLDKENGHYGYGGLIIYHNNTGYQAFDRACPYNPHERNILDRDEEFEGLVECPECGSRFLISQDGMAFSGPATKVTSGLKQYNAYLTSSNTLRVTN